MPSTAIAGSGRLARRRASPAGRPRSRSTGGADGQDRAGGAERRRRHVVEVEPARVDADPDVAREALAEPALERVAARQPGAHEEPAPRIVRGGAVHGVSDRGGEHLGGVADDVRDPVGGGSEALERVVHDGVGDRLLRGEVVVERPEPDVRRVRDLLDGRRVDALARHQLTRRADQARPRLLPPPRGARP